MRKFYLLLIISLLQIKTYAQTDSTKTGKIPFSLDYYKKKTYLAVDEIGGLFGITGLSKNTYFFSYHSVNAYQFDPHAYVGLGFGVEVSGKDQLLLNEGGSHNSLMFPLYAEIRGTFGSKKVAPILSAKGGYSFYVAPPTKPSGVIGGAMAQWQFGFKAFISKWATFNFSVGYRLQYLAIPPQYYAQFSDILSPDQPGPTHKTQEPYHFATVHAGFTY